MKKTEANTPTCADCSKPITGMLVGSGAGPMHPHCYELRHPPRPARDFTEVAGGGADPVLAREIICARVPAAMAQAIVDEYNARRIREWSRRTREEQS